MGGIHPPATRRHREAASRDKERRSTTGREAAVALDSDSYRDPRPRPPRLPPTPASSTPARPPPPRPGPALTHLQAQGRPAGAQELADVAQALALVPRLRVDLQHTASLSGPDASSAPFLGLYQSPPLPAPGSAPGPEVTSSNRAPAGC